MRRVFSSSIISKPLYMILMGAPGVGKGTYGKRLAKDLNLPIFSTGDYIRKLISRPDIEKHQELVSIKKIVERGDYVSDSQIIIIIKEYLKENKFSRENGVIFDGIPRTLGQAKLLDQIININLVVNFEMREDIIMKKLLGRRVCDTCGQNWNVCHIDEDGYYMTPLLPSVYKKEYEEMVKTMKPRDIQKMLDEKQLKCGKDGLLSKRKDDKEEIIKNRFIKYNKETLPLIDFYSKDQKVITFVPKRGVEDYPSIKLQVFDKLDKIGVGMKKPNL